MIIDKFPIEIKDNIINILASIKLQSAFRGYKTRNILKNISPSYLKDEYKYYGKHCNITKQLIYLRLRLVKNGLDSKLYFGDF